MYQKQVYNQPAPGLVGDFASNNPARSVVFGPSGAQAGPSGLIVGRFGWATSGGSDSYGNRGTTVSNSGSGAPTGFVLRDMNAVITSFLGEYSMTIPHGYNVELMSTGDFWAYNSGSVSATVGMKIYANNSDGSISANVTGAPPTGASVVGAIAPNVVIGAIAPNTLTGDISGTTLTVTAIGSGTVLAPGQYLSGNGVAADQYIVQQITGTSGGVGTYTVSMSQTVSSVSMTATGAGLTVSAVTTGALAVGQTLSNSGSTILAGTQIIASGTGTGGAGTYALNLSQTVASGSITASGALLTVSAVNSGTLAVNDTIYSGAAAGTVITGIYSGSGGVGSYFVNIAQTVSSGTTFVVSAATETPWYASTPAAPGEIFIISAK